METVKWNCIKIQNTSCTHKYFSRVIVVKERKNFRGNFIFRLFKDWPSASTHFDHLSDKLLITRQKTVFVLQQNIR